MAREDLSLHPAVRDVVVIVQPDLPNGNDGGVPPHFLHRGEVRLADLLCLVGMKTYCRRDPVGISLAEGDDVPRVGQVGTDGDDAIHAGFVAACQHGVDLAHQVRVRQVCM